MINLETKSSRVRILVGATVFILLAVGLYQGFGTKSVSRTPQASTTSKPTVKPTPVKVTPSPVKATPVKVTPTPVKVTPKPTPVKVTPKPTVKPTEKPVTTVKYGNTIPNNEVYPFPIVGKQIDPGYYYNSQGLCDILVYDAKGNEIFSEQSKKGQQIIISLKTGDQVQNYCTLTKGLPTSYTGTNIPVGMHIINGDLKPGTYTTSNNCSYWVSKGGSASEYTRGVSANIEQSFLSNAGAPFTLGNINEAVYFHSSCGTINKVG